MPEIIKNGLSKKKKSIPDRVKVLRVDPVTFPMPPAVAPPTFMPMQPPMQVPGGYGMVPYMDNQSAQDMSATTQMNRPQMPQGQPPMPFAGNTPPPMPQETQPAQQPSYMGMQPDTTPVSYPDAPPPVSMPDPIEQQKEREHARQQALRMSAFLPLAGMIMGGNQGLNYATQQLPGVATSMVSGADALTRERQGAVGAKAQMDQGVSDQSYSRAVGKSKATADNQTDRNKAVEVYNKYVLDAQTLAANTAKGIRESDQERVKIGKEYVETLSTLTPQSQQDVLSKMDPAFKERYGIVTPDGGFVKANPNEPSKAQVAQKLLMEQYGLLRSRPDLLTQDGSAAIVARIREYEEALGVAPLSTLPADLYKEMSASQRAALKIQYANAVSNGKRVSETIRHNTAMEGLRGQEVGIRAAEATGNPEKSFDAVSKHLQSLNEAERNITKGGRNSLTGDYMPPTPEELQNAEPILAQIRAQKYIYAQKFNQYAKTLGRPQIPLPKIKPGDLQIEAQAQQQASQPSAQQSGQVPNAADAEYNAWLQQGKQLGVPVGP